MFKKKYSRFKQNRYLIMINSIIPFNDINTKGLHLKHDEDQAIEREAIQHHTHGVTTGR